MAILVAVVSWPFSVPTIRSRMLVSCWSVRAGQARNRQRASGAFRLDDFSHGDAELVFHQNHFATRDQPVVDIDVDRLADAAVELAHGAGPELQQFADIHAGAAAARRRHAQADAPPPARRGGGGGGALPRRRAPPLLRPSVYRRR